MNNLELNDHVNNNIKSKHAPLTECEHTVPYGPGTGAEDPRAHDPKPGSDSIKTAPDDAPKGGLTGDVNHGPGVQ